MQDSTVSYRFVSNGSHVFFARLVAYKSHRTRRDAFDKTEICAKIGNATRAIRKFFNQELVKQTKWTNRTPNPIAGDSIIMREDNISPSKWPLARITELHLGKDNLVRVVTI